MRISILSLAAILIFNSCGSLSKEITIDRLSFNSFDHIKSGTIVRLKPGNYTLDSHILISGKENITLEGNGSTLTVNSLADDVILIENSKHITLKNFKATHIKPEGPVGCTGNVVHVEGGNDILITHCELNGCGIVGVAAYNSKNLKISNNHIHKNSEYGIIYQGSSVEISDNIFENNKNGNLYFSYMDTSWPPKDMINSNVNKQGLKMSNNVFK